MTPTHIPLLEQALIKIISAELDVMQSFCEQQFPCDLSTTIAMRMSRSIVSAICSATGDGGDATEQDQIISSETRAFMQHANSQLAHLSDLFEKRLTMLTNNNVEWKAWTV